VNYKNKFGETLVTTFIKSYYNNYSNYIGNFVVEGNYLLYKNAAFTLRELVKAGCDFNVIIDEDGNTPIIFFLLTEDYAIANYILRKCDIDVSIKNRFDISASLLSEFINKTVFDRLQYNKSKSSNVFSYSTLKSLITSNKTFDSSFRNNNNVSMNKQYRYFPSTNIQVIQQWLLEFLYPNIGGEYYYINVQKPKKIIS